MVECNFKRKISGVDIRCHITSDTKNGITYLSNCDEEECLFQQILKYSKYSRKTYVAIMEHWYSDLGYVDKGD